MPQIHRLSDDVINRIAAGEVVERPASVVKELVENAIDAGATQIDIYLENGGLGNIRVVDNGSGMNKEDLELAVQRHWTSKISNTDDLWGLHSFGFRGEALASIASVSEFEMRSKISSEQGYSLRFAGGEVTVSPIGMPVGTEVVVKNLFGNIPARKKFLRNERTEFSQVKELLQTMIVVHPEVGFSLFHNDKKALSISSTASIDERIATLMGSDLQRQLVVFEQSDPHVSVKGWIGRPGTAVASRPRQFIFVNNRPIEHRSLHVAVVQGAEQYIGRHEKPQFVLSISVAPHLVDINVHPQKKEVRFENEHMIFAVIKNVVWQALSLFERGQKEVTNSFLSSPQTYTSPASLSQKPLPTSSPYPSNFRESLASYTPRTFQSPVFPEPVTFQRPVFQLLKLFLVEEQEDGIVVYDQHAVHERVLYETLVKQFLQARESKIVQPLLMSQEISLSDIELDALKEAMTTLDQLGFRLSFTDSAVQIAQVPAIFAKGNLSQLLHEFADDLLNQPVTENSSVSEIDSQSHRRLTYMACRGAIKAGDPLTTHEARQLIQQFHATQYSITCPHGRPVQTVVSRDEIARWFKRT